MLLFAGGHTKEILLLSEKIYNDFGTRNYVVASSDSISVKKIHTSEQLYKSEVSSGHKTEVIYHC